MRISTGEKNSPVATARRRHDNTKEKCMGGIYQRILYWVRIILDPNLLLRRVSGQSWAAAIISKFCHMKKSIFSIFHQVKLTGGRLFNRPDPEIGYSYSKIGLEENFEGTTLQNRKPQMPSSDPFSRRRRQSDEFGELPPRPPFQDFERAYTFSILLAYSDFNLNFSSYH